MKKIVTEEEVRERLRKKGYSKSEIDALIKEYKEITRKIETGAVGLPDWDSISDLTRM